MFDGLLKSKFYSKCKSDIKLTRSRIEMIKKKRNAMQKYLRNDVSDLLKNGLGMNAYSRVDGLLIEINRSECYEFIDQCCVLISNHLAAIDKQRDCPEECRESVASLMFAAARIADLPELRELRNVFSVKYGNSFDCFANKELVEKLKSGVPSRETKLQLLQEIAGESGLAWNTKALDIKLFNEQPNDKDLVKETSNGDFKLKKHLSAPEKKKDFTCCEQTNKLEDRSLHKKENTPVKIPPAKDIRADTTNKPIENQDRFPFLRNQPNKQEERGENHHKYGLIPPPYSKSEAERTKATSEGTKLDEEKPNPMPKSFRRGHLKPPPVQGTYNNNDKSKVKVANMEQAAQAQRVLKFLDKGNKYVDEEERVVDRLLRHYSRKKGTYERVKSDFVLKVPFEKSEMDSSVSKKEMNSKEGPVRVCSLPSESSSPNERSKRHVRANSFQPEMLNRNLNHVHPKLPDCDDFEARLAELRRKS